ncbi:MarR family winged helix-turn-helix transcriptional regulator [Streptomyces sp. NPDC088729]
MHADAPDGHPTAPPGEQALAALPRIAHLGNALAKGRVVEQAAETAGLSKDRPAITVLLALGGSDGPLRVGEIADRVQLAGPHVTRQVQALERRGLVRRIDDPHDKRARLIEATARGREATDRYTASMIGWFTETISHWPEQDRADLGRLLTRLADDVLTRLRHPDDDQSPPA